MRRPAAKIIAAVIAALAVAFIAAAVGIWAGRAPGPTGGAATTHDEAAKAASRAMTFTQPEAPSK
ncbi:hypothetical protein KHC23_22400 [Ancylobacter dichloromethanicus]|uniref:Uncharacterized protein n=1 Tax=Ancylobacter dichloromethanicus TaxID=518825 RepID=A0A9W6N113_9HYPH|nr:hypothetical protein [Ancylobacter dichloromethanicus]MBS7556387.1 hypothetical protein [Ancylobacter dichloromethanicus]GLK73645.1 hypothetical protein GCM10017643_37630 [Ancylobacter dichloromethanicus]